MAKRRKIEFADLQFSDERLNRLAQAVRRIANEMQDVQRILEEGEAGQILTKLSGRDYDIDWVDGSGGGGSGGSGEANTAQNIGSGAGVFHDKTGVVLSFRSLRGDGAISITQEEEEIVISASASALTDGLDALVVAGAF